MHTQIIDSIAPLSECPMTLVNHVDLQLYVWGNNDISPDNALWEGVYHIYTM